MFQHIFCPRHCCIIGPGIFWPHWSRSRPPLAGFFIIIFPLNLKLLNWHSEEADKKLVPSSVSFPDNFKMSLLLTAANCTEAADCENLNYFVFVRAQQTKMGNEIWRLVRVGRDACTVWMLLLCFDQILQTLHTGKQLNILYHNTQCVRKYINLEII